VAAGLDSQVLGEPQILGQVAEAYSTARQHDTAGKILSRLFQTAIRAGKRTRTETKLGHNPGSIASVAVRLIARSILDLKSARILVIGAGEMAELAVEALRKRGVTGFTVANRTVAGAKVLADRWNGRAAALESLPELLAEADAVITSTGAPHTIISRDQIETALAKRPDRPLVLMDIAMPRDVEPGVGDFPNVKRFDLDSLASELETSLARREAEIPAVEAILAEEQAAFNDYLAALDVLPIIVGMRAQADAIREAELEKALRRMPELTPEALQQLDLLTRSIVKKLLHHPTIRLREIAGRSDATDDAEVARRLFGLAGSQDHRTSPLDE
jgi:glutamyl-tRNA reductase